MKKCIQWHLVPVPPRTVSRPKTSASQGLALPLIMKELASTKTLSKTRTEIQPTTSTSQDPTLNLKELPPKTVRKSAEDGAQSDLHTYARVI